jgi:histidinol-phosphatase
VTETGLPLTVLGEEYGGDPKAAGPLLHVDPIDGTENFIRRIPVWATLLAVETRGRVVAGLVSAPAMRRRWWGSRGAGAHAEDRVTGDVRRLKVSGIRKLADAQVFFSGLAGREAPPRPAALQRVLRASYRQRGFGDFWQHMLVAEGAGEVALDPVVKPWDVAPLKVIVEEAGGRLTGFDGSDSIRAGSALSTNRLLHRQALELL